MRNYEIKPAYGLEYLGLSFKGKQHWNLAPSTLVEETLRRGEGMLADNGALCIDTGTFTGRSPKDKFVVKDQATAPTVWWGKVNQPMEEAHFDRLYHRVMAYLQAKEELYCRDLYAGADPDYRIKVRVVNTIPSHSLFVYNMFILPEREELAAFVPEWTVVAAPGFLATPELDGTRQGNFTVVNFTKKIVLVGGSGYTGEMKKGIFSVLNYLLPFKEVLPMHCSANVGKDGDTAIFFGLSGTGKTTLSTDPDRNLIGDDEHAWTEDTVFNFEGGCYAKTIDLSEEKEPQIWNAIRFGALVENTRFFEGTRTINYEDVSVTENTRVSYPISHIEGACDPSVAGIPKNIFFLTADAFGVLPPISKLSVGQAMYQFISGYTAKVAGTEEGVTEPQMVFSPCFGEPFLPLHPTRYAELLGDKIHRQNVNVWLINTGWTGGAYGVGSRIKLRFTRAMIKAALEGKLDNASYKEDPIFGLQFPTEVEGVPSEVLNPQNTWEDAEAYKRKAYTLAEAFIENFRKYEDFATEEMLAASPKLMQPS